MTALPPSSGAPPPPSVCPSSSSSVDAFLLLANGTKGAAAMGLVHQILNEPTVFVFGELLDHPNIQSLEDAPGDEGASLIRTLHLFAFGTYRDYLSDKSRYTQLTDRMKSKLRLLTLATLATRSKQLRYEDLQRELDVERVRDLEDLIIEATSYNVVTGKLDQKEQVFDVDSTMARDIQKTDVANIINTLETWCSSCEGMLGTLETEAARANDNKQANAEHRAQIHRHIEEVRKHVRPEGIDDPDSRMETSSTSGMGGGKKGGKTKGLRGSSKAGFWQK